MKVKTSELQDDALNYAVAICEGFSKNNAAGLVIMQCYQPSSDGRVAIPIIEKEGILLRPIRKEGHPLNGQWLAMYDRTNTGTLVQWVNREGYPYSYSSGKTSLIAAMQCYVASKLGDEVEIPEELI